MDIVFLAFRIYSSSVMPDAAKMNTRLSYLVVKETDDGKPAKGRRINYVRMWSIAGSIK